MRAAIVLAGCFLVSSSAFTAEPQMKNAARKPVVIATTTVPTLPTSTGVPRDFRMIDFLKFAGVDAKR